MKRRMAREKALQALFQIDMSDNDPEVAIDHVLDGHEKDEFLTDLVNGVNRHHAEIDKIITAHLQKWTIDRLANVDRTILRLAVYELKYRQDIPQNVVLNEAIEIAKMYSDEESSRFINGVLDKIKAQFEQEN